MKVLTHDEYIAEMNRRLQGKSGYKEGMRFEAFPPGATGAEIQGIAWVPGCAGVMTTVHIEMGADFVLQK